MFKIAGQFQRLIGLCVRSPGGRANLLLFLLITALTLGSVYASVRLVEWTGAFYSALEKVNGPEVLRQIGIFAVIIALNSARHLLAEYLRKVLEIRWRRTLTDIAIDRWTANKAFWHLAQAKTDRIDNPDQRIAEDCRLFVSGMLSETLDLISRVVGLVSFVAILWSLSNFPLSLAFVGIDLEIPHYMVWAAFLYVAVCSGLTHLLGRPLKRLFSEQQHREADFRYAMARWRTSFDEVALSNGEDAEKRIFRSRFDALAANWRKLITRELILGGFTYPFNHSVLRIPLFIALPGYLAGHVAFGGLMQLSTAFSQVVTTLSWFIFSYRDLADLVATASRLDAFMQSATASTGPDASIQRLERSDVFRLNALLLDTPDGRSLLAIENLTVSPGESVWLRGPSGIGKTTLMKAVAGLWPHGTGEIRRPREGWMFLPQKPYLPLGTLVEATAYPSTVERFGEEQIRAALCDVGLEQRVVDNGAAGLEATEGLSGGELQRLAIARLLLHAPRWAILDEATSALDPAAEAKLLSLVRHRLPQTALILIAHRAPQTLFDIRAVDVTTTQALAAA
ncbi:ABC transporter ATP-binding protein/permease [Ensifer sp. HO-A22]|uniref:ABC transporter ATP-binding protein/permease n=1 Tax=Ensifer oleiphilus TaxID=2742698 RepID=A0A7Y6QD31_9HYPH|nr:ABC transporter ATP-binding protein/permease [Ensifer oleiphilus]NVD43165.1 ABC transporter ATP-binding protein/permease [Ensifer oleiphilus]